MTEENWSVYILKCADNSLYTGVALDVNRRVIEHNSDDKKGARYTRARRPVSLVWSKDGMAKSQAYSMEANIKKLTRKQKLKLISEQA